MNIYQLFTQDQLQIKELIEQLENTKDLVEIKKLLNKIHSLVFLYTKSEEESLYKTLRDKLGKLEILVEAGDHEHKLLLSSIEIMQEIDPFTPEWSKIIKFAKSLLEQHTNKVDNQVYEIARLYLTETETAAMLSNAYEIRKNLIDAQIK